MKFFLKLNLMSILCGLFLFIPIELMMNVYRIDRLTGWGIGTVNTVIGVSFIVIFVFFTILLVYLTNRWMDGRKAAYWTTVLWLPYFIFFIYVFARLFPITYGGDDPNPVTGLLSLGAMMVYPIFILIILFIGLEKSGKSRIEGDVS